MKWEQFENRWKDDWSGTWTPQTSRVHASRLDSSAPPHSLFTVILTPKAPVCSWALWRHALRRPGVGRCVGGVRVVGGWLWRVFAVPFGSPPSLPPNNPLPCSQGKPLNARAIHCRVRPRSPAFHALAANEVSKSRSGVTGVWPTLETLSGGAKAALWLKSLLTSNQRTMCSSLKSGGNCDAAFDLKSDLWICSCLW